MVKYKKIIIYGTGNVAKQVLENIDRSCLLGFMDRYEIFGEFCGYPFFEFRDLNPGDADAIIIASSEIYQLLIYKRIFADCQARGIAILDPGMRDMRLLFGAPATEMKSGFSMSQGNLEGEIRGHEVISFDIFDTLFLRKVTDPLYVFDLTRVQAEKEEIVIRNFRKIRRHCELLSKGKDIHEIYRILEEQAALSHTNAVRLMQIEFSAEKQLLCPRKAVVDLMRFARAKGKKVVLTSDMYWPTDFMKKLLDSVGISDDFYDEMFISCEAGKGKTNGLFDEVLAFAKGKSVLHIGDSEESDVRAACSWGIDGVGIYKATELLFMTPLCCTKGYVCSFSDSFLLGQIAAALYNSPFQTIDEVGKIRLDSLENMAEVYYRPILLHYLRFIADNAQEKAYDSLLFPSRDGWLFYRAWQTLHEAGLTEAEGVYFLSSRKLLLQAVRDSMPSSSVVEGLEKELKDDEQTLDDDVCRSTKKGYKSYLKHIGLNANGKYLFCGLDGRGTEYILLTAYLKQVDGLLYDYNGIWGEQGIHSVFFHEGTIPVYSIAYSQTNALESVFTSDQPSVDSFSENSQPVYLREMRTEKQIDLVKKLQTLILNGFVDQYIAMFQCNDRLNEKLLLNLFSTLKMADMSGTCSEFQTFLLTNDFLDRESKMSF